MTKVEHVANAAVVLTCVVTLIHSVMGKRPNAVPETYKPGEKIVDSGHLGIGSAGRTLIMFESSTCHFCNESLGFYSKLSGQAQSNGVRIVAVAPEEPGVNKAFLLNHGVTTNAVVALKDIRLKVFATPTLILVRSDGTVIGSWVGKLQPEGEVEVTTKVLS